VVLQTYRYSDTSKILRLMTLEHGPRSAVARGALRPKSRFGGLLEPFCEGDATLYLREQRDLHTLSSFELVRERRALGSDMGRFSGASVMCELVMRLAPEHRDDRLYHTLTAGLDGLLDAAPEQSISVALAHVWQLVRVLGFAPDLDACLQCGRAITDGEEARFDFAAGGLRCGDCALLGRPLNANELASLRALVRGEEPVRRVEGPQSRLLAEFIRYHLAEGSRLRSLAFLLEST
jgi:DNA repair protein RecO (recombination protein O)